MKRISAFLLAGVTAFAVSATVAGLVPLAASETTTMVGGAPMYPSKNIVQNAVNSKDHTTLVAAVKAAGLVQTLEGAGPFTVFAPTNTAFNQLPAGIRADQRRFRQAAGRHGGDAAQAREQTNID